MNNHYHPFSPHVNLLKSWKLSDIPKDPIKSPFNHHLHFTTVSPPFRHHPTVAEMAELCNPALQGDPFCKTLEPIGFEHERHRFSVAR